MGKEGWFNLPGRLGDRELDQQLMGLTQLLAEVAGKSVLDVGCAEGLISHQLARAGAASVHGVEIVKSHVKVARAMTGTLPCTFEVADANHWEPPATYDVVVMLALLHKLWDPSEGCRRIARAASSLVVIRNPPGRGAVIVDERSKCIPHDIGAVMKDLGFRLDLETTGPFNEWMGYWRRVGA
jgi:SAM-dependent methyltransferase